MLQIPLPGMCQLSVFFDRQDTWRSRSHILVLRRFANYKAHYRLSWFRPLLGDNSPTSNGLILKMNSSYIGCEQSAPGVH
jgi:hypothetical protein